MKRISTAVIVCALASLMHGPDAEASSEKVLYSFCSLQNCADGELPAAAVIIVKGMLYGTTGANRACAPDGTSCGTVFSVNPQTDAETVLHAFQDNGRDGWSPAAGLIHVKGKLYGTTSFGGSKACYELGCGTVFSVDLKTGAETVLHRFKENGRDGTYPYGGLISVNGMLYGTTSTGGTGYCETGCGTVFSLDPEIDAETVYSFGDEMDGASPQAGLTNVKGTLYGTTRFGGTYDAGTVFSLNPKTSVETVLHSFGSGTDGWYPVAGLINIDGTLYGTTSGGPSEFDGNGTVFSVDLKTGAETVLHRFKENGRDGLDPYSGLIDVNGTLYGTTELGGAPDGGTLFSFDLKTGKETVMYSFSGVDGLYPVASPSDIMGTFYGTTNAGGTGNCVGGCGTVFSIVP